MQEESNLKIDKTLLELKEDRGSRVLDGMGKSCSIQTQ